MQQLRRPDRHRRPHGAPEHGRFSCPASASAAASPTHAASPSASAAAPPKITGNLTIFAASSLTDAYNEMKGSIEAANPGTVITYNFTGFIRLADPA